MQRSSFLAIAVGAGLIATTAATETEDALYDGPIPDDAVFIRQIGAAEQSLTAFGREFQPEDFQGLAYSVVSAETLVGATGGQFFTLVPGDDEMIAVEEPARTERGKVHLFLLNTDAPDARLIVAGTETQVIAPVEQGGIISRAVNPVAITLSVETTHQSHAFELVMRRGQNLTFLVANDDVQLIEHTFGPVLDDD